MGLGTTHMGERDTPSIPFYCRTVPPCTVTLFFGSFDTVALTLAGVLKEVADTMFTAPGM